MRLNKTSIASAENRTVIPRSSGSQAGLYTDCAILCFVTTAQAFWAAHHVHPTTSQVHQRGPSLQFLHFPNCLHQQLTFLTVKQLLNSSEIIYATKCVKTAVFWSVSPCSPVQCFSIFVRPRPGKLSFIRRGPGPNKFTRKYLSIFLSSYIKLI